LNKQDSKYRWVVFSAVMFTYFLIVTQRTAPGLISDQLMKEFQVSASTIGLLTSIQFLAYAGLQVPVGVLSDRYGPNFFLIIGALLNGLGTVIYSIAPNELALLFARLLVGIGDATIWVNLVLILSQWFKVNEFIGLLGLAGMSGSLGFLMATVPFSAWISLSGWRQPFLIVGILLSICSLLLFVVLVKKPKQMNFISIKKEKRREKTTVLLRQIFSSQQAWATFLCHFGLVGTYVGFIGSWAVPYGMHVYDMTRSQASQLIMYGLMGAFIGAPLTSWISSRLNRIKRPYIIVHSVVFLSWAVFLLFNGKPPFLLLIILFLIIGFGNGSCSLTFAAVRQHFPMKKVGVASGFANTGGFISAVLLPIIFGKILDHFHSEATSVGYLFGLMIPVVFSGLGLIGSFLLIEQSQEAKQSNVE
jgi:MFS family permease